MKKFLILPLAAAFVFNAAAQETFSNGDTKVGLTIGVGTVAYADKNRATFDQHLTMEWGVASVADKFTIGVGFAINNQYGGQYEGMVAGEYKYQYYRQQYGSQYSFSKDKWERYDDSKYVTREGGGTATADVAREDVDALFIASLHFSPMDRLDTYCTLGLGVGCMSYVTSNYRNTSGFSDADFNEHRETQYTDSYIRFKYNDLDHVKWKGMKSKVVPSMAFYIGATYYLNSNWGLDAQLGLINANFKGAKKGYANSYGVFALGASYKF